MKSHVLGGQVCHELKTWPEFWRDIAAGRKTFEVRKDDRGFQVGDLLVLFEWSKTRLYTGRRVVRRATYILRAHPGLSPGFVVMGLGLPTLNGNSPEPCICNCALEDHDSEGECKNCGYKCYGYWPASQDERSRD